jgi:hypothetical protein
VDFVTGKSTGYESLDDLILSSSVSSSSNLVSTYLSSSFIDTDSLNIEYASGSEYLWNNFVHFSSAKERVDNFVYKVQLIEAYETLIVSASNGAGSIAELNEKERQTLKKNQLIQGFDGFEKFLYTSSSFTLSTASSLTWPYNGNARISAENTIVKNWYANLIELAETYDVQNPNWVQNNIPQYIVTNAENDSLLLFFSMIGQHFDNIYYHTKAIEKSRGLGYKSKGGISDKILFDTLKSLGWDAKNLAADAKLWEYAFGLDSNGSTKYETPAKKRTYEVWRRIVNNLPYLLKHKGTRRGIYAIMSCYGIPSSNLSILEFGGPEVTDETKGKYEFDNITTGLKFTSGAYVQFDWKNTERNRKPDTIEFFVKPSTAGDYDIIQSDNGMVLNISGSGEYGVVTFNYVGNEVKSSTLPIFNGKFFGIEVSREVSGSYHNFELNIRQADKERTIFQQANSSSILAASSAWNNGSYIRLGNDFVGTIDEFRLWSTPLDKERFYEHVSFPEMINGNHVSASTDDLYFRLDFEYPKNLAVSSSLINVDTNMYFSGSLTRNDYEENIGTTIYSVNPSASFSASAYNFVSSYTYPYQFEVIDRTVVLEMPDAGSSRYSTNKVRFETQYTLNGQEISGSNGVDLSVKSRATKKAFDQSPTDSNRVGLFFSPTKELNIDIAKSLGGLNLDNYIGDPADRYKDTYKRLDDLRHYYFQRFDGRDIYQYINLIKLYEKSMFDDIKKMLPARVKATTGLLIEPHFLERSKIAKNKPTGENEQYNVDIHYDETTFVLSENSQREAFIDANLSENIFGENNQYDGIIYTASIDKIVSDSYQYETNIGCNSTTLATSDYYQKTASIDAGLDATTILSEIDIINSNLVVGQTPYETVGFGIYGQNGYAIRTYIDADGITKKERIKVDLIKEQKQRDIVKYKVVVGGKGDERGGLELTSSVYYETYLNIQPFSGSKTINAGTGSIVSVTPLSGYLPTHYRKTSDLTRGLENSFFRGSKNTAATTLDGTPPVEVFTTNPNTLRVNKAGRDASEPILEVE